MKPIIFLDMDGVLANWHQAVCDLYGIDLDECDMVTPWEYAIEKSISHLTKQSITGSQMWALINKHSEQHHFWYNIKPYPWAWDVYRLCQHHASELIISTSPGYHWKAWGDKVRWLQKWFNHSSANIMMGPKKHFLAGDGKTLRILVDDSEENIKEFKAHGGIGILFPQQWNTGHNYKFHERKMKILTDSISQCLKLSTI